MEITVHKHSQTEPIDKQQLKFLRLKKTKENGVFSSTMSKL